MGKKRKRTLLLFIGLILVCALLGFILTDEKARNFCFGLAAGLGVSLIIILLPGAASFADE